MKFPKHEGGLILTHNDHKSCYRTVKKAIDYNDPGYRDSDWVSEEQKQKAIETNDCWTLQWYPNTPISFNILSAADLEVLLKYVGEHDEKEI